MSREEAIRDLAGLILFSKDIGPVLYKICELAIEHCGATNAMVALFNEDLGYMTMRAGMGKDWSPEMLGNCITIADQESEGVTAYVAATGKTFIAPDVKKESRYRLMIESSRSEMASPIFDKHGRVRGVVNVESNELNKFHDEERVFLELLAMLAGNTIEREDARQREKALIDVGVALDRAQTEEDLLSKVAQVTQSVLNISAYSIFLWDERENAYVLRSTAGETSLNPQAKYAPGEGCTGWVAEHGEPIRLDNPKDDERFLGKYLEFPVEEIGSFLAVPIFSSGRSIGCIRAMRKLAQNRFIDVRFTDDDESLLIAIAEQLGAGLEKLRSVRKLVTSERMAAWGELSARSAHMIGNRVFAIRGDINELRFLLSENPISRENAQKALGKIELSVEKLEEILRDFRDFVTATSLTINEHDLNQIVKEASQALVKPADNVQIKLQLDESVSEFGFDAQKMERAISELIENSLHFMNQGVITISTGIAGKEDLAKAGLRKANCDYAKIVLEDQGPGIEPERKRMIFDPYHTSRVKGMGLGLSIVKGIIDSHQGRIFEDGEPGKGARFVILLPIQKKN